MGVVTKVYLKPGQKVPKGRKTGTSKDGRAYYETQPQRTLFSKRQEVSNNPVPKTVTGSPRFSTPKNQANGDVGILDKSDPMHKPDLAGKYPHVSGDQIKPNAFYKPPKYERSDIGSDYFPSRQKFVPIHPERLISSGDLQGLYPHSYHNNASDAEKRKKEILEASRGKLEDHDVRVFKNTSSNSISHSYGVAVHPRAHEFVESGLYKNMPRNDKEIKPFIWIPLTFF